MHFVLNGMINTFKLFNYDLQRVCPCANCRDELTGQRLADPNMVAQTVRAVTIQSVGRYGLKIHFTSGCSTGIYSFDQLRLME